MRRSLIGKRGRDAPSPFANLAVRLLEPRLESKRHAVTNVDPVGVIEHFTFADVGREAGRWAQLLRLNGLQPGDRVLVLAGREWAWRCALLGVLRAGGVAVPCPASMPLEEVRAIRASAGAQHLISIPARPELAEDEGGLAVLDADGVDAIDASRALREPAHQSHANDVALVLYARHADGLRGAMHTHASLIAQADAGKHWLGVGEDEPVWCTAAGGSPDSIWLLLAAWHEGANIVNVDLELDPDDMLELLGRLGTAAVWFSDKEYGRLESATPAAWINGSIKRALLSDERSSGATAFANAVGASVAAVLGIAELGVVAGWPAGSEGEDTAVTARPVPGVELAVIGDQGTRLPAGLVGEVVARGEALSLVAGNADSGNGVPQKDGWFRFGWQGALTADGALRLASRSPGELEPVDAEAEAEDRRRREEEEARKLIAAAVAAAAEEAENARREAAAAEERRRAEERLREDERRLAEQEAARRAEQEAKERERAEAAARAEREAEERRRTEEEAKRRADREAREREQAEAAARAAREAEERRRAEEEQRREEERRRQEEEARRRAEQETRERELAEAAAVADRAAAAERRRDERAEKERAGEADGDFQNGHAAVLGAAVVPEISESGAGAADPFWRHPGAWAWQLLAVVSLLVVGALLAAYFLARPKHSTATRTVTVATTPAATRVQVPDVVKQQQGSALTKLRAAGFDSRVKTVPATGTTGVVIRETPAAGTKVRRGSAITLWVSVKKAQATRFAKRINVPNVLRLEETVAQSKLTAAGLGSGITYAASPIAPGQVISQSPAGGGTAKQGTEVLLTVSRRR